MQERVFDCFRMTLIHIYDTYLGLLAFVGLSKAIIFDGVRENVWRKLQIRKIQVFSAGGREILTKVMAQVTSIYTMHVFKLPTSLCKTLQSLIARFLWGENIEDRKIHWLKWKHLCRSNSDGGMRFWDLRKFDQSLLAKQDSWILTRHGDLFSWVFKAKYFRHSSLLLARLGSNPSYVWRRIMCCRELLDKRIRCG